MFRFFLQEVPFSDWDEHGELLVNGEYPAEILGSVDISRHSRESGNLFPFGSTYCTRTGFPLSRE